MKCFDDLMKEIKYIMVSNNKYYNLLSLYKLINKTENQILPINDKIILPFYICDNLVYEIYDFELFIKVGGESVNNYILNKTGKSKIEFVNEKIINKLKNCYISPENKYINNDEIIKYIRYIFSDDELRDRISNMYGDFDIKNIFFEIY